MPKMIQIRNVPDDLHRKLKTRAAANGRTLSDYLLAEIQEIADKPTLAEMLDHLGRVEPVRATPAPAELVRQDRDSR